MALTCYLAMTAAEILHHPTLPPDLAWMSCHFSSCGTGLSNLPAALPGGAMVILDDSVPISGHDASRIAEQLKQIPDISAVLLDFQRPGSAEAAAAARAIVSGLACPVGVSECYAADLNCPVFLPPLPPDTPLDAYLRPWKNRPVWLEAALGSAVITVTAEGSRYEDVFIPEPAGSFVDSHLHCHYRTAVSDDKIRFFLTRTPADLAELLEEAGALGVGLAVGLYQELGDFPGKGLS